MMNTGLKKGFTLIELLIVVAIIAILAAIAVPNFLEAQIRAKTSRVKNDLRTVSVALNSYMVDHNKFPPKWGEGGPPYYAYFPNMLTTPVAYLASASSVVDTLRKMRDENIVFKQFMYTNYTGRDWNDSSETPPGNGFFTAHPELRGKRNSYCVSSWGPDNLYNMIDWAGPYGTVPTYPYSSDGVTGKSLTGPPSVPIYDPTNGTISYGDIPRWGP